MIDAALAAGRIALGGVAAEWLARIALRSSAHEHAATWLDLMRDVYRTCAPQHLQSSRDLLREIGGEGTARAALTELPIQARTLRDRVPPAGELGEWAGIHLDSLHVDLGALRKTAELPHDEETLVDVPVMPGSQSAARPLAALLHRFAGRNAIEPKDFADERLIIRTCCEVTEDFTNFLKARQVHPKISHKLVSEQDYLILLEANLGIGLMPESTAQSARLACVPVNGLELSRTVSAYAVAGRQRSSAVSTFVKLLRASDWPTRIGKYTFPQGAAA
jgi:hypothetical protein